MEHEPVAIQCAHAGIPDHAESLTQDSGSRDLVGVDPGVVFLPYRLENIARPDINRRIPFC